MPSIETLQSFVNRWECDENDHMNVQFYAEKFDEAGRQFCALTGVSAVGARRVRNVRYRREARAAAALRILSSVVFDEPHPLNIVHELFDATDHALIASAVDGYSPAAKATEALRALFPDAADSVNADVAPKGLAPTAFEGKISAKILLGRGAMTVHRNTVLPRDCGPDSHADGRFIVGCFSAGAAHVWERTPMDRTWLEKRGYGRIALEMKISYGTPAKVGAAVQVLSGITAVNNKTFVFRHHLLDAVNGATVAVGDVVAALLDLNSRRMAALPNDAAKKLRALVMK